MPPAMTNSRLDPLRVAMLGVLVLLSCRIDPPNEGALVVTVRILADPVGEFAGASELNFDSTRVDVVHRSDAADPSTERVLTVASGLRALDVPLHQGEVHQVAILGVPEGAVYQVRFVTAGVSLLGSAGIESVKLPSGEQTGLKFVPAEGTPFVVRAKEATTIEGQFNPNLRLNRAPGQGVMLKPTVKTVEIPSGAVGPHGVVPGRVIVSFQPGTERSIIDAVILLKGTVRQEGPHLFFIVSLNPEVTIADALDYFSQLSIVTLASPDFYEDPLQAPPEVPDPNDARWSPDMAQIYGLVGARSAWYLNRGKQEIVVAVIDTGFDIDHPDLVENIYINEGELPSELTGDIGSRKAADCNDDKLITFADLNCRGCNVASDGATPAETCASNLSTLRALACASPRHICIPDGEVTPSVLVAAVNDGFNGDGDPGDHKNDVIGWDFEKNDRDPTISIQDTTNPRFLHHGTAMAGIIGAVTNNGPAPAGDVVGTAWNVRLVLLRSSTVGETRNAIAYAAETLHAHIISHSAGQLYFAGDPPSTDQDVCRHTESNVGQDRITAKSRQWQEDFAKINLTRTLLVNAAGNCPTDLDQVGVFSWPSEANSPSVAAVSTGGPKSASGATSVDLAGPGNFQFVLRNRSETGETSGPAGGGTSDAAAYVSGVAALALSAFQDLRGRPFCLRELLVRNSRPSASAPQPIRSGGWLNMYDTVTNATSQPILLDPFGVCPR